MSRSHSNNLQNQMQTFNKLVALVIQKQVHSNQHFLSRIKTLQQKQPIKLKQNPIQRRYNTPYARNYQKILGQRLTSPVTSDRSPTEFQTIPSSVKSTLDPQKLLSKRKKQLLDQLRTVDQQLKRVQLQKSKVHSNSPKRISQAQQSQRYKKASNLVSKMNIQRKQFQIKRRKKAEEISYNVQKSLKDFQSMNQAKQRQRQEKRKIIEKRIDERKNKIIKIQQSNRFSNKIIQQIQQYKASLPIFSQLNPQQVQAKSLNKSKVYPKSHFLESIQKQQLSKKKQQFIKNYERKKKRQRQIEYGRKVRGVSKKQDNSVFVT